MQIRCGFDDLFHFLCELNMFSCMDQTSNRKVEAKHIFHGHLEYTNGCALTWNNLFSRYHANPLAGQFTIFETHTFSMLHFRKMSLAWWRTICPVDYYLEWYCLSEHAMYYSLLMREATHTTKFSRKHDFRHEFDVFSMIFSFFSVNSTFSVAWTKLWTENWKPNRFFLDT